MNTETKLNAARGAEILAHMIERATAEIHKTDSCERELALRDAREIAWSVQADVQMTAVWQELGQ